MPPESNFKPIRRQTPSPVLSDPLANPEANASGRIGARGCDFCAKRSLRPTAEKDRDVIFVRSCVRPSVKIIITFSCGVRGAAALWYFETKIFRNLKKDAR